MTKTILVIDDDKMLRTSLASGLRKAGFSVVSAENAENAVDVLARVKFDAIVLDRMMDGIDGLTFLKQIRLNGDETPVIMLTALSGPENTIDGLANGANDYLAKPFQLQELILRLNNITKNTATVSNSPGYSRLFFTDGEVFIRNDQGQDKLLSLSTEEKKLLQNLTNPIGNTVSATPMVAKRLRNKINGVLSDIDIITVRGMGYKIITKKH